MRIAQVAPLYLATPPRSYGGTERVISMLTEGMVARGHEVTLFATGDSTTSARLVAGAPAAMGFEKMMEVGAAQTAMLANLYSRASDFDVIHSHLDYPALPFAATSSTPTVFTIHGALNTPGYPEAFSAFPTLRYVSISDSQRAPLPNLNWVATIYHGINVEAQQFGEQPGDYLLFVGRISPEKGPDRAIAIAKRCGIPLKIAAKVDPKDRKYFDQTIKPLLDDPLIEFVGPVNEQRKMKLMREALALLLPIRWAEPFGLVYIEALSCGLPVLTCPLGAAPEILKDDVTGFMRETDEELADAARRIHTISRVDCRSWAKAHFDAQGMTDNYLSLFQSLLTKRQRPREIHIPTDARVEAPKPDEFIYTTEHTNIS